MSHPMARCGGTEVGAGQVGKPRPGLSGTAWVRPEPTLVSAQQTPEPTPQRGVSRCQGTRSHRIPPAVRTLPSGRGEGCLTTSTSNSSQSCRVSGGHDPVPSTLGGRPVQRAEAEASVKRTEPDGLRFHFLTSSSKDSAPRAGLAKAGPGAAADAAPCPTAACPCGQVRCGDRRPTAAWGARACACRTPAVPRQRHTPTLGAWLGAPRGPLAWAPTSRARGNLHLTPKVARDKPRATRNVVICFVSALDHQSCVAPYKIALHNEPGRGCVLDPSQPPRRQLRRKLGASGPGPWARSGFPGCRPLRMGTAHRFAFPRPPMESSKRHPSGTH